MVTAQDTTRARRTRVLLVMFGVVVLLALCIVAAAAVVGSWERDVSDVGPDPLPSLPPDDQTPEPDEPPQGSLEEPDYELLNLIYRIVLVVIGSLLLAVLIWAASRAWRALVQRVKRGGSTGERGTDAGGMLLAEEGAPDAEMIVSAIAEANAALASTMSADDAIIAAWLALERAAERSGVPRHPAQTPTEFTAAILERTPADAAAVAQLAELYHHARFSTEQLAASAPERARAALSAIGASWAAVGVTP